MASAAMANERHEETRRWDNNTNYQGSQHYRSQNYSEWGQNSYGVIGDRRRQFRKQNTKHGQNQGYNAKRGSAAMSPQWQPQSPPPPPPPPAISPVSSPTMTYSGAPEQSGPVAVDLSCLPYTLCRQPFLEAMLDQAGLADDIMGCVLSAEETGKATIYLANMNAALKCVQHFAGRRWDSAGPPVMAQVAEGPNTSPASHPVLEPLPPRDMQLGQEQMVMSPLPSPAMGFMPAPGSWGMPQPMLPLMAIPSPSEGSEHHHNIMSRQQSCEASPLASGSDAQQHRWVDVNVDGGNQYYQKQRINDSDLSEGREGSTSAGESGRNGEESTSFNCDVDTDDGF